MLILIARSTENLDQLVMPRYIANAFQNVIQIELWVYFAKINVWLERVGLLFIGGDFFKIWGTGSRFSPQKFFFFVISCYASRQVTWDLHHVSQLLKFSGGGHFEWIILKVCQLLLYIYISCQYPKRCSCYP